MYKYLAMSVSHKLLTNTSFIEAEMQTCYSWGVPWEIKRFFKAFRDRMIHELVSRQKIYWQY